MLSRILPAPATLALWGAAGAGRGGLGVLGADRRRHARALAGALRRPGAGRGRRGATARRARRRPRSAAAAGRRVRRAQPAQRAGVPHDQVAAPTSTASSPPPRPPASRCCSTSMPTGAWPARRWRSTPSPMPAVHAALAGFVLLKADVTANDDIDQALMQRFGIIGPPATLFFVDGAERRELRLIGFEKAGSFVERAQRARATDRCDPATQGPAGRAGRRRRWASSPALCDTGARPAAAHRTGPARCCKARCLGRAAPAAGRRGRRRARRAAAGAGPAGPRRQRRSSCPAASPAARC